MGTIAQKLGYAITSKEDYIKEAIELKGVIVGDSTLREYADRILEIQSGGGGFEYLYFNSEEPPTDHSLIWVECDEPDEILISDIPAEVGINKTTLSATLSFNLCANNAAVVGEKIYIPGAGYDSGSGTNRIHVFDTTNDTITLASNMYTPATNYGFVGVFSDDNYFYTMGGQNGYSQYTTVYRYNPATGAVQGIGNTYTNGDTASATKIGNKVYYTQLPWYGSTQFAYYDTSTNRSTYIGTNAVINGQFGMFAIGENLYCAKNATGIYQYDFSNNTWSLILEDTDVYGYRNAITTIENYAVIFCGTYAILYDTINNTSTKILDGEIAFAGNASGQSWAGWWACATKGKTVYCFGTNLKGGRAINKIVFNFKNIVRIETGDAPLQVGENMELDFCQAYYNEVEISVYKYDETQEDWIEVIGNKVYDLTYAEDEEGF